MVESPFQVIFEMISTLITSTFTTMGKIIALFGRLMGSLGFVSEAGGFIGFGLSVVILIVVGYFLARFLLGGAAKGAILIILAILFVYMMALGVLV